MPANIHAELPLKPSTEDMLSVDTRVHASPIWSTTWFQSGKTAEGVGQPLATRASRSEVRMATMRSDMILSSLQTRHARQRHSCLPQAQAKSCWLSFKGLRRDCRAGEGGGVRVPLGGELGIVEYSGDEAGTVELGVGNHRTDDAAGKGRTSQRQSPQEESSQNGSHIDDVWREARGHRADLASNAAG